MALIVADRLQRSALFGLALGLLVAMPSLSFAQTASPAAVQAKEQFDQGQAAVLKGDLRRARALFIASQMTFPATGTLLNLADCEQQLELPATALRHYREALPKLTAGDPRIAFTKGRIAALEPLVPTLTITLSPSAPVGARVLLDSREIPRSDIKAPLLLDPGKYTVTIAVTGREERVYPITLAAKKHVSVIVEPGPAISTPPDADGPDSPRTVPTNPPAPQTDAGRTLRGVGSYVLALGVAGSAATFSTSIHASAYDSGSDPNRDVQIGVGLAAAAVVIGAGVTLRVVGEKRRSQRVSIGVSPSSGQVTFTGSF